MGITSYRLVKGKLHQTRKTRIYARVVNILFLAGMPYFIWRDANLISANESLPPFIRLTPFVLHCVTYAVIFLILTSRCFGENALLDFERLNTELNRNMTRYGKTTSPKLRKLFIFKTYLSATLWLTDILTVAIFLRWVRTDILMLIGDMFICTGFNIMVSSAYLHFMSFWNIARGYEFVNQRMDELIPVKKPYTSLEKEQIYQLWALHSHLGRTLQRLQMIRGHQMLALRFEFFLRAIIHGFHCFILLLYNTESTPKTLNYVLSFLWCMRNVGCFLNDYIMELTTEYQCSPKDLIIEGLLTKEVLFPFYGKITNV